MSYSALLERLSEIQNINKAGAVLSWDQHTYMPPKGAEARARQVATLAKMAHERCVSRETQDLLAAAEGRIAHYALDSDERALLRRVRHDIDRSVRVPTPLVVEMAETFSRAEEVWQGARAHDDYARFAPWLEKIVHLKRQFARCVEPNKSYYDALFDEEEEGANSKTLAALFDELKKTIIPLLRKIQEHADRVTDEPLTRDFNIEAQRAFATQVLTDCGFDFQRARLDVSVHPFCTDFSQNDVRITTRYDKNWLPSALFGCLHEMGHAFYELNGNPAYEGTYLAGGTSLSIHESQSRLWENQVGRSLPFWQHYYPLLQKAFPGTLADVPLEKFHKSVNHVSPSFIRVEADEVTYNLHIILRFEMEQDLLENRLSVADAPAAWNQKMHDYLGITPPNAKEGILQDVHWSFGGIGYFPTYTMGNVISAQLFAAARHALPSLQTDIGQAHFGGLYGWLRVHVHQFGRKYRPDELIRHATGESISTQAYLRYLTEKFAQIYEF
jgi:carboxypeptidase Taq